MTDAILMPRVANALACHGIQHEVMECLPDLADMEVKRASFADTATTTTLTGMLVGGVTAAGIDGLPIYVDSAVARASRIVMGGGNRTSKIVLSPPELLKLPRVRVIDGLARAHEATSEA